LVSVVNDTLAFTGPSATVDPAGVLNKVKVASARAQSIRLATSALRTTNL